MIKIAIEGAETKVAGDLIRILILHPEVELISVASVKDAGKNVKYVHHGLEGERDITITALPDYENADIIFICTPGAENLNPENQYPQLRTIYVNDSEKPFEGKDSVPGFPEIYRKELVRGAKSAFITQPVTSAVLAMLFPLAKNLMLNPRETIKVEVLAPMEYVSPARLNTAKNEILSALQHVQTSFEGDVDFQIHYNMNSDMKVSCILHPTCDNDHLQGLFRDAYSDHNFTHETCGMHSAVSGTQKILYSAFVDIFKKKISIEAICDPEMRGGATEAVHVMNLMCGFHEKTGLAFKASLPHLNRNH